MEGEQTPIALISMAIVGLTVSDQLIGAVTFPLSKRQLQSIIMMFAGERDKPVY